MMLDGCPGLDGISDTYRESDYLYISYNHSTSFQHSACDTYALISRMPGDQERQERDLQADDYSSVRER